MRSRRRRRVEAYAAVGLFLRAVRASNLPYNPASFLVSPPKPSSAYLFAPVSSTSQQFQLLQLDLSSSITSSSPGYTTIASKLPFLDDTKSIAFVAVIDGDGFITVLAGDCTQSNSAAKAWRLDTGGSSGKVASSWTQLSSNTNAKLASEFLSSAVAFSSIATGPSTDYKLYTFGGMCPFNNATQGTWTSAATYVSSLNKIGVNSNQFDVSAVGVRSSPVPQAGYSLTPLTPTFSNRSDGSQTSQQNFLLLGGHTNSAFLNLSQAALLSLPQETWTYLPIPSANNKTDMSSIEPRSGHTATLSLDGRQVVVFGGWIGDVNTPASPQMVVLNLADGYGGSGPWGWTLPSPKNTAMQPSSGMYGHAAVMLPGNVLLVTGGYSMGSSSARRRDVAAPQMNTKSYMYNITSSTWIASYNAPPVQSGAKSKSNTWQKIGIGVGVTLAIVAVIGSLLFYSWYKGRLRRRQEEEEEMRAEKEIHVGDDWESHRNKDDDRYYRHAGASRMQAPPVAFNRNSMRRTNGYQPGLTGDNSNAASAAKRNNSGGRGPYPYERSRNKDPIHPIMEGNEDSSENLGRDGRHDTMQSQQSQESNPFVDPADGHAAHPRTRGGSSVSSSHEQEIENWSTQWARAGSQMMRGADDYSPTSGGRTSPTKSDHTTTSTTSVSPRTSYAHQSTYGPISVVRSLSQRSAAIISSLANPFSGGSQHSTSSASSNAGPIAVNKTVYSKKGPSTRESSALDFATMQAESKAMLGSSTAPGSEARRQSNEQGRNSPTRRTQGTGGWVGSVRRVIGMSSTTATYPRSASLTTESTKARNSVVGDHSSSQITSTAVKVSGYLTVDSSTMVPRRSASDAAFWKSKRGAKDWGGDKTHDGNDDDDEWDVETAAQDRVVQLMFTVPKERLRVVNADIDGRSIISAEEGPAVPAKDVDVGADNWKRL